MNLKHVIKKQNSKVDWAIFWSEPPPPKWAQLPFLVLFFNTSPCIYSFYGLNISALVWMTTLIVRN